MLFYGITFVLLASIFLIYFLFDSLFEYSPIFFQAVLLFFATNLLGMFYIKKEKYKKIYGEDAYVKAFFRFHVTAMPFIYMSTIHPAFTNYSSFLQDFPQFFSSPYYWIHIAIGGYLLLSGLLLHPKVIKTFGFDNLFMYYVYFPEKGEKNESPVYGMMRHPLYSAMARIALGLGILRGTVDSICVGAIIPLCQFFWLAVYEEPDLIKRFGEEYKKYQKSVWAIFVKPKYVAKFWKYLILGS